MCLHIAAERRRLRACPLRRDDHRSFCASTVDSLRHLEGRLNTCPLSRLYGRLYCIVFVGTENTEVHSSVYRRVCDLYKSTYTYEILVIYCEVKRWSRMRSKFDFVKEIFNFEWHYYYKVHVLILWVGGEIRQSTCMCDENMKVCISRFVVIFVEAFVERSLTFSKKI